jgi:hypothetical protein
VTRRPGCGRLLTDLVGSGRLLRPVGHRSNRRRRRRDVDAGWRVDRKYRGQRNRPRPACRRVWGKGSGLAPFILPTAR